MVSSSSTKKAARLAQKGKGKKVRFQGGTLFPAVVLLVLVLGLALIVYARASRPAADASPPTIDDHWHLAYGFDLCDVEGTQKLSGNKESDPDYARVGVHSHDDGVIHWHASSYLATGHRAQLGVFLDVYGVELDDDSLAFPADQLDGREYVEGETQCGDEDGKLAVAVWDNFTDTGEPTVYTSGFADIPITNGAVMVVAFIPESADARELQMPSWAADLDELAANDLGAEPPSVVEGGTVPASTTAGTAAPVTGSSAPSGTAGEVSVPASIQPATTTAATSTTTG